LATLFISDLHLDSKTPHITDLFLTFLKTQTHNVDALYILGDLFEVWIGDDDRNLFAQKISQALHTFSQHIPIYFMHGNRDFLLGEQFAQVCGMQLLSDPTKIDLYGVPTLLLHGDSLCIDDVAYQQIRKKTRDPIFQQKILNKPLWLRKMMAKYYRAKSRRHNQQTQYKLMDVNQSEIEKLVNEYQVQLLIHGHTHKPTLHYFQLEGRWIEHIVLSDWHAQSNVLICSPDGEKRLVYF
jgi:UDP-2,3-diacylglucosamine hydrolase